MKVGDRVCAAVSLHRTGVPINADDCGSVIAIEKGRDYSYKTGFGRERSRTSDRIQVRWDRGPVGWHYPDVLEKESEMRQNPRKKKHQTHFGGGVMIRYSPVNQAYFVMWHDQVLRIFNRRDEAESFAKEITMSKLQENARRRLSKKCQAIVSRTAASEQRKGVPQKQAVAIGYSKARRAGCRVPPPPRRLEENPYYVFFYERGGRSPKEYAGPYSTKSEADAHVRAEIAKYGDSGRYSVKNLTREQASKIWGFSVPAMQNNPISFWGKFLG